LNDYYSASAEHSAQRAAPVGAFDAAVVVIGGGFAGLYTALELAEQGQQDVILLEAEHVGFGASGRNGGFVFSGYSLGERSLLRKLGPLHAAKLYGETVAAVNTIRQRISKYAINCELVDQGVLWVNWFKSAKILHERAELLAKHFGADWQYLDAAQLRKLVVTNRYSGALFEPNAMHLHPLKYARGLAQACEKLGVRMFESARVSSIRRAGNSWVIGGDEFAVSAKHAVIACGGYLQGLHPKLQKALLPIATYVMATEKLGARLAEFIKTGAAIYDTRFAFDYYRALPDTRLLWGGRISIRDRTPAQVAKLLKRDMLKVFPQLSAAEVAFSWSGLMSYARHEMPQLGELEPGLWYAQAFGGHGLAPTAVAGKRMATAILHGRETLVPWQRFNLPPVYGFAGKIAAQCRYWQYQFQDAIVARF
jgi:gamma-glutamylputrescine oxidase